MPGIPVKGKVLESFNPAFGERLRIAREAAGLRQADLAKLMGVGQEQVSKWESGKLPMTKRLELLATSVGSTVEWLLFGKGKAPKKQPIHPVAFKGQQHVPAKTVGRDRGATGLLARLTGHHKSV